jgi:hypothetical protein
MRTDKTKNQAGANVGGDCASVPVLGSARGRVEMQRRWDAPMGPDEVEEVFFPCEDEAAGKNR